ncbi:MAG TPA: hypothetical protein VKM72_04155 [Thermoanaerobaculia bacterium]|nr:hypothetical protein [Thermoanaerobaculia bacterium]
MQKRSLEQAWRVGLAAIALIATAMALYVQLFERTSQQDEEQLAAARLETALAESRVRLKAEILTELRAELAPDGSPEKPDNQPLPNSVLRRGESGTGSTLQQVRDLRGSQEGLGESLDSLLRQTEESDRALRQDLEELRAEVRRERDVSGKVVSLLLAALVPLVAHLLVSVWLPRSRRPMRHEPSERAPGRPPGA